MSVHVLELARELFRLRDLNILIVSFALSLSPSWLPFTLAIYLLSVLFTYPFNSPNKEINSTSLSTYSILCLSVLKSVIVSSCFSNLCLFVYMLFNFSLDLPSYNLHLRFFQHKLIYHICVTLLFYDIPLLQE